MTEQVSTRRTCVHEDSARVIRAAVTAGIAELEPTTFTGPCITVRRARASETVCRLDAGTDPRLAGER